MNEEVEISFSVINYFKSKIRNRMSVNIINSLFHIKYGRKLENSCWKNYVIPDKFYSKIKNKYHIETVLLPEDSTSKITYFLCNIRVYKKV